MLNINSELVCSIAAKIRVFQAQEGVTFPAESLNPGDDWSLQMLAAHRDNPHYLEAKAAIDELEPDQQITLVALMWLGRGDFAKSDWEQALAEAGSRRTAHTADYLLATPLAVDYWEEALAQFGYSCEE